MTLCSLLDPRCLLPAEQQAPSAGGRAACQASPLFYTFKIRRELINPLDTEGSSPGWMLRAERVSVHRDRTLVVTGLPLEKGMQEVDFVSGPDSGNTD